MVVCMVMGVLGVWIGLVWLIIVEVEINFIVKEKMFLVSFRDIVCFWSRIGKYFC